MGSTPLPGGTAHRPTRPRWAALALVALALLGGGAFAVVRVPALRSLALALAGHLLAASVHQPNAAAAVSVGLQDPVTVLVMGVETSAQYNGQQTDSMMLWGWDPASSHGAVISVPRDLWIDIPGHGEERINSALEVGGYRTAELAVERYIGVPVEHYAVVDYAAFVKLVNDVGGIDVNVPYDINDSCYPNAAENACTVLRLSKGPHHMDGATALAFARERHSLPQGDLDRAADQQLVLFALKRALLKPANLLHLPTLIGDMERMVTTDLPYAELPQLASEVLRAPESSIAHAVLDYQNGAVSNYTTGGGADVLLPHAAAIRKVVAPAFAPVLAHMSEATVQVENGAPTRQPLATYFTQVLSGMGVTTLPARQASRTDYTSSAVYWNTAAAGTSAAPPLARMLAAMLGTEVQSQPVRSSQAEIVVILGGDFPKVQP